MEGVRRMALLTAVSVTTTAADINAAAVTTSDTISQSDIGVNGCFLNIINASGSAITTTIVDPGTTAVGNAGTAVAQTIPAGDDRWIRISPYHVNSAGVATITNSSASSITYKLLRAN